MQPPFIRTLCTVFSALCAALTFTVWAQTATYLNTSRPIDRTAVSSEAIKASPLYSKKLAIIGDSYVRNHRRPIEETWHYLVAEKYGMDYYNYGKNGNCVAFDRTRRGFGIPMHLRCREIIPDADYIIVVAGHNDADMIGRPDTTLTSQANALRHDSLLREFEIRLNEMIDTLITHYPKAKLAFVTPWNVPRPGFEEMFAVLRKTCAAHSVPLLDAARSGGIHVRQAEFRRRYFQGPNDTAHLNAAGHHRFMSVGEAFLLGL